MTAEDAPSSGGSEPAARVRAGFGAPHATRYDDASRATSRRRSCPAPASPAPPRPPSASRRAPPWRVPGFGPSRRARCRRLPRASTRHGSRSSGRPTRSTATSRRTSPSSWPGRIGWRRWRSPRRLRRDAATGRRPAHRLGPGRAARLRQSAARGRGPRADRRRDPRRPRPGAASRPDPARSMSSSCRPIPPARCTSATRAAPSSATCSAACSMPPASAVTREYYFNDFGTQVKNLGASVRAIRFGGRCRRTATTATTSPTWRARCPRTSWPPRRAPGGDAARDVGRALGVGAHPRRHRGEPRAASACTSTSGRPRVRSTTTAGSIGRSSGCGHGGTSTSRTARRGSARRTFGDDKDRVIIRDGRARRTSRPTSAT